MGRNNVEYKQRKSNSKANKAGKKDNGREQDPKIDRRSKPRNFRSKSQNNPSVPTPAGFYEMYRRYTDRAQGDSVLLINNQTSEMDANIATITSTFVEPVMLRAAETKLVDKFSATEIADYSDYIVYGAHLLLEMRAIKFLIDTGRSITRADTAGNPWTKASYNAYVSSMCQTEPVHIPIMSYNLAGLHSTPLVMAKAIETKGYPPMYYYPMLPSSAPSDIETLLSTMATKLPGLIAENQYHKLGRFITPADLQYRAPVMFENTEIGTVTKYYQAAKDDTNGAQEEFDASYVLQTDEDIPCGVAYDYHRLYSKGASVDFFALGSVTADKVSLKYAAIDSASLTEVADYLANATNWKTYAAWSNKHNLVSGAQGFVHDWQPGQNVVVVSHGETSHNRVFQQVLTRDIFTEKFPTAGLVTLGIVPLGQRLAAASQKGFAKGRDSALDLNSTYSSGTTGPSQSTVDINRKGR